MDMHRQKIRLEVSRNGFRQLDQFGKIKQNVTYTQNAHSLLVKAEFGWTHFSKVNKICQMQYVQEETCDKKGDKTVVLLKY